MSSVRGRISVDVQFADSTTSSGVQSLKTIAVQDATEYTTGKVAIVTGTVGTAAVGLWNVDGSALANQYRTSAGQLVGPIFPTHIALRGGGAGVLVAETDVINTDVLFSRGGVSVCEFGGGFSGNIRCLNGTATYTVVLYGT